MITQGEFMDVTSLQAEGLTIKEITDELGYHPAIVSTWLAAGGSPPRRLKTEESRVMDSYSRGRINAILERKPRLLSTSFSIG